MGWSENASVGQKFQKLAADVVSFAVNVLSPLSIRISFPKTNPVPEPRFCNSGETSFFLRIVSIFFKCSAETNRKFCVNLHNQVGRLFHKLLY